MDILIATGSRENLLDIEEKHTGQAMKQQRVRDQICSHLDIGLSYLDCIIIDEDRFVYEFLKEELAEHYLHT